MGLEGDDGIDGIPGGADDLTEGRRAAALLCKGRQQESAATHEVASGGCVLNLTASLYLLR